jgi:ABC-type multidrug transport system permease subunit
MLEFVRDPAALFWVFGFPILLAVGLGIAFRNQGPEVARLAVIGPQAEEVARRLDRPGELQVRQRPEADALFALRTGQVDLVARADAGPDGPRVSYRFDPSRPGALATRLLVDDRLQRAFGRADVVAVTEERVEEVGGRYIDFLVPGLIGLNLMGSAMWGMGYAIVDARRRKLLKRFAVTPMNRSHFLLSYMFSRLVFLILELIVFLLFSWLAFGVGVQGAPWAVAALALLGTLAFSGLAMLIAARTASTEVASGWMNLVQLPMWLLSGSFFAYSRFPEALHPVIRALPLTALNDSMRAVVNPGASLASVLPEMGVLALWGVAGFLLALRLFRWH